jgi:hypothetical protein
MTEPAIIRGRTVITTRALESVLAAVAARELGTAARTATARVRDSGGSLAVSVTGPTRMPDPGDSVLAIAERTRLVVSRDGAVLTGATIGAVRVRIDGVDTLPKARVR